MSTPFLGLGCLAAVEAEVGAHCTGGRHGPLSHYCWWNKHVANPIKKWGYEGKGRKAMMLLKHEILTKILLRRTKVQCADVLALPPRSPPKIFEYITSSTRRFLAHSAAC